MSMKVAVVGSGPVKLEMILADRLRQLEAKAAELDRREKGVAVKHVQERFGECGYCNYISASPRKYCHECGTKLMWDSEVNNE